MGEIPKPFVLLLKSWGNGRREGQSCNCERAIGELREPIPFLEMFIMPDGDILTYEQSLVKAVEKGWSSREPMIPLEAFRAWKVYTFLVNPRSFSD